MTAKLHPRQSEKGQSLIELAVGLVVLLILLAGIIDLGRLLFFYISLRDAAQEGAVFGQINPRSCNQIVQRINDAMNANLQNPPEITVDGVSCLTASSVSTQSCSGKEIKIRLTAPYKFMMPLMGGRSINLSTEITGTILRPACGT